MTEPSAVWWDRFEASLHEACWSTSRDPNAAFEIRRDDRKVRGALHAERDGGTLWHVLQLGDAEMAREPETVAVEVFHHWRQAVDEYDSAQGGSAHD